jgi:DNA polymerase-3 subunit alpha
MPHADFVHLRLHSAYSLSEGAIKVKALAKLCESHGMPAAAVTDKGNLFGALEISQTLWEAGIQPIIGCQVRIAREDAEARGSAQTDSSDEILLLVQSEAGYRNLTKLVSLSYLESDAATGPQVTLEDLERYAGGLIAFVGSPESTVGRLLGERRVPKAEDALEMYQQIFEGRLYIEIMRHDLAEEAEIEDALVDLAYRHDLPLVATNDVYFAGTDMHEAHDALLCIADGTYLSQSDRRRLTPDHRFKSAEEMQALFEDLPEAIDNTLVIARRCAYRPEPVDPILPPYPTEVGRDEAEELRAQAETGLEQRLESQVCRPEMTAAEKEAAARPYRERLKYELDVIRQMGFPGYFLIVADFIQWAKRQEIPVGPGRGSGAGSVVAWALTITDLDPLRWGLLFERFLNPERVSMPDFDVDFCQDQRDTVIRYVQDKYGKDHVAQIITFGKLQARAALRDVGRVLQMPYPLVDRLCKMVPYNPANPVSLQQAIDSEAQLQEARANDDSVARLLDMALKLEGLYRNASTHAAGVVIGDRPLDELVPLYRDPRSDMPATQFNMKYVESAGLVKFDFLGLKTLSVLARARDLIRLRHPDFDLKQMPLDDPATYELLRRGETMGVFQLEGAGMRDVLRRLKPDRFEDIIAVVALYRPGPMDNIDSFIARKHGEEAPDYLYPSLEGILRETHGIMIYQEQVMQIAQELAGYSLGSADLLRRAMGKKIKSEMEAQRKNFIDGAMARGVDEAKALQIFEQVAKFAGYGFNKSHAAAYALIAVQTAYLKANHPVEFMAASMTYDLGNTDKLNQFRQELNRLRIPLLSPDVNRSDADFRVEQRDDGQGGGQGGGRPAIRYALAAIKNVGEAAMKALTAERETGGPFHDLGDFAKRLDVRQVNKRQIENLARAGAFDSLDPNRRQVYEGAELLMRHANLAADERDSSQTSLFGDDSSMPTARMALPEVTDWPAMDRLRHEFEAIGFYLSAHPLESYGRTLARLGVVTSEELPQAMARAPGRKKMAGIVIGKREITTRQGKRLAFVQISDMSGVYEVSIFAEVLGRVRELLETGRPLLLNVDARQDGADLRLNAQDISALDETVASASSGLRLYLNHADPLEQLQSLLARDKEGSGNGQSGNGRASRGRIALVLATGEGDEVELELPGAYRLSAEMRRAIKAIPGMIVEDC